MQAINMFQAKSSLSKLVATLESGKEEEIIISRHGKAVARLTAFSRQPTGKRIGIAKGKITIPDDIDADNQVIAGMFAGKEK